MNRLWIWLILLLSGCAPEPTPLPTQAAVEVFDRQAAPPLYQLLYSSPILPEQSTTQAQLRMLKLDPNSRFTRRCLPGSRLHTDTNLKYMTIRHQLLCLTRNLETYV